MSRCLVDSAGEIEAEPGSVKWVEWGWVSWKPSLGARDVAFTLSLTKVILKLDLDWMAPSHYSLRLEIVTEMLPTAPAAPLGSTQGGEHPMSSSGNRADARDTATAAGSSERRIPGTDDSALEEELLNEDATRPTVHEDPDGALSESNDLVDEGGEGDVGTLS